MGCKYFEEILSTIVNDWRKKRSNREEAVKTA